MRDLTTRDYRFRFRDPQGGQLGEIPYIEIRDNEELPPLRRARTVYIHSFSPNEPASSTIAITWVVSNTEVILKHYCRANCPRLKKEYQANPPFAEQVINILGEERNKHPQESAYFETPETISKDDVPEPLRPSITQVEVWQTFFQKPAMRQLHGHHYCQVNCEGYYMAAISRAALILGCKQTDDPSFDDGCCQKPHGFDFDPKTEPPTLEDNAVYWELAEPKILVILPHDSADERVAAYYGYLPAFREYQEARKALKQRWEAASLTNEAKDAEQRRRQAEATRQALLSP